MSKKKTNLMKDGESLLPMIISEIGSRDEPILEVVFCDRISGGADYVNGMPQGLTLIRRLANGEEHKAEYTIHEERSSIFVKHIENHLTELGIDGKVICKICGKSVDEIYEEEMKK